MKQGTPILSKSVFNEICDILCIPNEEREKMISLDVHLHLNDFVTYDSKKLAQKDVE